MREHYQQELEAIGQEILKMGVLVEENLLRARDSLVQGREDLALEVKRRDALVDSLEQEILGHCTLWIAREQPVASDLRHVVACLKVISDLERMGDYAVHLAKRSRGLSTYHWAPTMAGISTLTSLGTTQLRSALGAFLQRDPVLARQIAQEDGQMDRLKKALQEQILSLMEQDPTLIRQGTRLIGLVRELERVGDRCVYICGWAVYSATGHQEDLTVKDIKKEQSWLSSASSL